MLLTALAQRAEAPLVAAETLLENPHARLAELREEHAVIRLGKGQYMALRAADAIAMLTDPRTIQIEGLDYARISGIPQGAMSRFLADFFLLTNHRDHRAKRGLFARSFSLARMRAERESMRAVAEDIVTELPAGEPFDFVDLVSARVPAEMIARILGLDPKDAPYFSQLVYLVALALNPIYPLDKHPQIERAASNLFAYVSGQMAKRVSEPRDDMLCNLMRDWADDSAITLHSLIHQVMGMIIGGVDTTRAAFAMLVSLLLQDREQWEAVKADPGLIPGAVAEALRFEPSVGSVTRVAIEDIELGGYLVPRGSVLRVSTMSAMRDPDYCADPEVFDIHRQDHPRLHTVFGHGPHRCIGEMLARFEMEEALAALITFAPDLQLVRAPRMTGYGGLRQITPMLVRNP